MCVASPSAHDTSGTCSSRTSENFVLRHQISRQQHWARNSKGTETLKQQVWVYLFTSHTQACALTSASEMTCQTMSSCGVGLGSAPQRSSWPQLQSKRPPGEEGTSQRGSRWLSVITQKPKIMNKCSTKSCQFQPRTVFSRKDSSYFILSHDSHAVNGLLNGIYCCITHMTEQKQRIRSRHSQVPANFTWLKYHQVLPYGVSSVSCICRPLPFAQHYSSSVNRQKVAFSLHFHRRACDLYHNYDRY